MIQTYQKFDQKFTLSQQSHSHADAFWVILGDNEKQLGQCTIWWRETPSYLDHQVGLIGHFEAENDTVAQSLLNLACEQLAMHGCTQAIAPMDGNPWQRYRVIMDEGTEPPFFLEPDYPVTVAAQFITHGFEPIAHYHSALNSDLTKSDPRSQRIQKRLKSIGINIRCLNLSQLETELQQIYQLICISFRHNFLYMPVSMTDFIEQYQTLLPYIKPEFVLIAEHQQQIVGVLFAIPNWLEIQQEQPLQTIILKTVAVLPRRAYAGLGQALFEQCHAVASQAGYRRAIYALIHEQNSCLNLVQRYASSMRRYAVLAKAL